MRNIFKIREKPQKVLLHLTRPHYCPHFCAIDRMRTWSWGSYFCIRRAVKMLGSSICSIIEFSLMGVQQIQGGALSTRLRNLNSGKSIPVTNQSIDVFMTTVASASLNGLFRTVSFVFKCCCLRLRPPPCGWTVSNFVYELKDTVNLLLMTMMVIMMVVCFLNDGTHRIHGTYLLKIEIRDYEAK